MESWLASGELFGDRGAEQGFHLGNGGLVEGLQAVGGGDALADEEGVHAFEVG